MKPLLSLLVKTALLPLACILWLIELLSGGVPASYGASEGTNAQKIADAARAALGKDMTPDDRIPDEVACVTQLVNILPREFGISPNLVGTGQLYAALLRSPRFRPVSAPAPGTIVVSVTRGNRHGHCGIYVGYDQIASNNSFGGVRGLWTVNYTRRKWIDYFYKKEGLAGYLFAPVEYS
jgi:hypothetical protein